MSDRFARNLLRTPTWTTREVVAALVYIAVACFTAGLLIGQCVGRPNTNLLKGRKHVEHCQSEQRSL